MTDTERIAELEAQLAALEEEFRNYGARWSLFSHKWHWRECFYDWPDLLRAIVEARK